MNKNKYFLWTLDIALFMIVCSCASTGAGMIGGSLTDTEISAMAALGRTDEALSGPLFEGDGGADIRLAVLEPEIHDSDAADAWLPVYVQGLLHSTFRKYSAMTLIDRQNLNSILSEQELAANGRFSPNDFVSLGNLTNAEYFLTGTIQKLPDGEFSINLSITGAGNGESRASFMRSGTAKSLQDGTLINNAVVSLLEQMGVNLTETGRRSLATGRYMAARAEADFAHGLAAQERGAEVAALLNYSQAAAFDPSQIESLVRLGSVSSEIGGGSVSLNILNDIQARNAWIDAFHEVADFFNSRPPFEITYDPNLTQLGITDYEKNQADLAMWIKASPSEAGFEALNALLEGLEKTGRRETWGFAGWPLLDINPRIPGTTLFAGKRSFSFDVHTALVNEQGKVISRGSVALKTGEFKFKAGDKSVKVPADALSQVVYSKVNAMDLTPTLTVVITGVNGMSGRQISASGYMRIAPGDVSMQAEEYQLAENQRRQQLLRQADQQRQQLQADQRRQGAEPQKANNFFRGDNGEKLTSLGANLGLGFGNEKYLGFNSFVNINATVPLFWNLFVEGGLDIGFWGELKPLTYTYEYDYDDYDYEYMETLEGEKYQKAYRYYARLNISIASSGDGLMYLGAGCGYTSAICEYEYKEKRVYNYTGMDLVFGFILDMTRGTGRHSYIRAGLNLNNIDYSDYFEAQLVCGYTFRL